MNISSSKLNDPNDSHTRAKQILQSTPLIDGHNDFPCVLRQQLHGKIYSHDFENDRLATHTDIQKLKDGMMGVSCFIFSKLLPVCLECSSAQTKPSTQSIASTPTLPTLALTKLQAQFWSVYVPCPENLIPGVDLNDPNKRIPGLNEPNVRTVPSTMCP